MSNKELTSHESEQMMSSRGSKSASKNHFNYGILAVCILVLCGVSFGAGISYQKGKKTTASTAPSTNAIGQITSQGGGLGGPGGQGGPGNGQRPNIGEVSAISSGSITIQATRSTSNQTFKITGSTTVQNNGSTASVSDIKTGDTVLITTDSSDTSTATQIMLNPSFGSPPGGSGANL